MLASGFTKFWEFMILTLLPLSICFCLVVMLVVEKDEWRSYYGLSLTSYRMQLAKHSRDSHTALLCVTFRAMLPLSACGLCFLALYLCWAHSHGLYEQNGGCVDPLIQTSCATSLATPSWQWTWVLLSCCTSIAVDFLLEMMQRGDKTKYARAVFSAAKMFLEVRSEQKAAIANWKAQMPGANKADGDEQPVQVASRSQSRNYLYYLILLPLLLLASLPSALYILAKVPLENL